MTDPQALHKQADPHAGVLLSHVIQRIIWLCMLPLFLFAAGMTVYEIGLAHRQQARQAAMLAENTVLTIENALNARINALNMLALSPLVDEVPRWPDLHREALGFYRSFGTHVVLSDGGRPARMLLNTRVPFGTTLPVVKHLDGRLAGPIAMRTGRPAVSDLFEEPVAKEPLVGVAVPVLREGKAKYALLTTMERAFFQKRLDRVALPTGWSVVLNDAQGATIAGRSQDSPERPADRFVADSPVSGWTVSIEIPSVAAWRSLVRAAAVMGGFLLGVTLAGLWGGRWAGRRLSKAVASLVHPPGPGAPQPDIVEIIAARRLLDEEREQRAAIERTLRNSEAELRLFIDHAPAALAMFDQEMRYLSVSRRWISDYKLDGKAVLGQSHYDVFPEIAENWKAVHRRGLEGEMVENEEESFSRLDGSIQWLHWVVRPWRTAEGAIGGIVIFTEDITDRKQAQEMLQRYELLANHSRDIILFIDKSDYRILEANAAATLAYGYSREELLALKLQDLRAGDTQPLIAQQMETAFIEGIQLETVHRRKDGTTFPVEVSAQGAVIGGRPALISVVRNIAARKLDEAALRESEAKFSTLFHYSPNFAFLSTVNTGEYIEVNDAYCRLTGYTREELLGHTSGELEILPAAERKQIVARLRAGGRIESLETTIRAKRGEPRTVIYSMDQTAIGPQALLVCTGADITARKQAEDAIRRSETRYRELVQNANSAIIRWDVNGTISFFNEYAQTFFGWKAEEIVGRHVGRLLPEQGFTGTDLSGLVQDVVAHPERYLNNINENVCRDGRRVWMTWTNRPVRDAQGRLSGMLAIGNDITTLKHAQDALQASLAEKEVLLKEIHHRVKNNLQVISSLVDLQADEVQDPAMRAIFQDVIHRVRSMAMVHEKLYQSTNLAQVEFADYARSLLGYLWRAQGTATGIRLNLKLKPILLSVNKAVPCGLILNELFSNALKHAFKERDGGTVTVALDEAAPGKVSLEVADDGIGLPPGLDWEQSRSLGLRIVKILARQLNASVTVRGDEGTRFSLLFEAPSMNPKHENEA